ncbi:MAG: hypothetical protein Q7O66_07400 [Dehalococcoidia bacterium]|nr:hypothetical protein [Dehalococcoidia bacterium]
MFPYLHQQVVFDTAVATATVTLDDELKACPLKVVEIVTTGFSGTLDIQGRISGAVTMDNVSYARMGQDGPQVTINDQLSYSTDTARYRYLVTEPYAQMQIVMTRTVGSVSVFVYGWAMAVTGPMAIAKLAANSGVDIGDVDVVTDPVYSTIANGELQGSASALQLPSVACRGVFLKAAYDNAGRVYVGGSGVTVKDGTTDTTSGIELNAGDEIFLPVTNLNILYRICDNAGDDLTYFALVS